MSGWARGEPVLGIPARHGPVEEASIHVTVIGGRTVVEVAGQVDLVFSPEMRRTIASVIESEGHLVLDLSSMTFMDSSGLNVLVGAARRLAPTWLAVAGCRNNIRRLFEVTGLDTMVNLYETVDEALTGPTT